MNRMHGVIAASAASLLLVSGCASGAAEEPTDSEISIGFFGFAAANSFAQGVYGGIEEAAAEAGATATFVDGNFDGQLQVQQITDAITTQQYDVIIIQANDNLAVQQPLQQAVAAGITVVVEFTPVGPDFDTVEPQVDGVISIVDPPVSNGEALGELGLLACEEVGDDCSVAYMEGFRSLPLDNARTEAVLATLEAGDVTVLPTVEGGYTQDEGRAAFQDIVQASPDVDVVIGSSQAVAGAAVAAGDDSEVLFVANGGSQTAVEAVRAGDWFGAYTLDLAANGHAAVELALASIAGDDVEVANDEADLAPNGAIGTQAALEEADFVSSYDD